MEMVLRRRAYLTPSGPAGGDRPPTLGERKPVTTQKVKRKIPQCYRRLISDFRLLTSDHWFPPSLSYPILILEYIHYVNALNAKSFYSGKYHLT
jgi:hypothetical protein